MAEKIFDAGIDEPLGDVAIIPGHRPLNQVGQIVAVGTKHICEANNCHPEKKKNNILIFNPGFLPAAAAGLVLVS